MPTPPAQPRPRPGALSTWLFIVAALVFAMVVVGGITRLTESGLSMVRWEPISGAIPPMNEEQWEAEFDHYRQSPQYREVNSGMSLDQFKNIFFWEYMHRLLGRIIGLAFALPLLWFWWRRAIPQGFAWKLTALLALGGLQGAIGWWMVASGLVDDPHVSHVRLAIHLLTALVIFGALVWVALDLRRLAANPSARAPRLTILSSWTLSALFVQMLFGAYVAGLDAGHAFSSWPRMGEEWFPADAPMLRPFIVNFVDNPVVVQFVHRWFAFVAAAFAAALALQAIARRMVAPGVAVLAAVTAQILLGIFTLLTGVELWIAVAHQGMAALLLASIVWTAHRLGERGPEPAPAAAPPPALAAEAA